MRRIVVFAVSVMVSLVGISAQLPRVWSPDLTITPDDIGKVITMPFYLEMPEGGDFTNFELHLRFPNGIRPVIDDEGVYAYSGDDIARIHGMAVVLIANDCDDPTIWPNYTYVGANVTKTPNSLSPNQFIFINVTADANYTIGSRSILGYMKYFSSDDSTNEFGGRNNWLSVCHVTFTQGPRIKLDYEEAKVEIHGDALKLNATISGNPEADDPIQWSSSDESVAIVSDTGLVYGLGYGKTIIRAELVDGSGYATCVVETYLDGDMDHNTKIDIDDINLLINKLLKQ